MTKEQIRAELRRSAMEDAAPWADVHQAAWDMAYYWKDPYCAMSAMPPNAIRLFFLLVAEAM